MIIIKQFDSDVYSRNANKSAKKKLGLALMFRLCGQPVLSAVQQNLTASPESRTSSLINNLKKYALNMRGRAKSESEEFINNTRIVFAERTPLVVRLLICLGWSDWRWIHLFIFIFDYISYMTTTRMIIATGELKGVLSIYFREIVIARCDFIGRWWTASCSAECTADDPEPCVS